MNSKIKILVSGAFLILTGSAACAADSAPAKPDAPELLKWKRTGEYTTCLTIHSIRESRILNSHQILFTTGANSAYLAEPDCPALSSNLALSYDATLDQLCNTTIIRLIESGSPVPNRGSCSIDRFERLEKKQPAN